jgi:two-component system LytT family response regulator
MKPDIQLKAMAVDDEHHCLETLKWELSRACPEVELIQTLSDADEAKKILPNVDIDLLFMDIHLQSTSGLNVIKELQPVDFDVIFVTAYDEYAIEAFETDALHYLLKPINKDRLRAAIDKVVHHRQEREKKTAEHLLKLLSSSNKGMDKIPFNVHSGIEFILPDDITYISGENNYSILHFGNGKKLVVSKTLSKVEEKLSDYAFLRIHKSYLINLKHIIRYVKSDGGYIEVTGGSKLAVSRSKKASLNDLFR